MQYYFGFLLVGIINTRESTYFYEAEASYLTVQPLLTGCRSDLHIIWQKSMHVLSVRASCFLFLKSPTRPNQTLSLLCCMYHVILNNDLQSKYSHQCSFKSSLIYELDSAPIKLLDANILNILYSSFLPLPIIMSRPEQLLAPAEIFIVSDE